MADLLKDFLGGLVAKAAPPAGTPPATPVAPAANPLTSFLAGVTDKAKANQDALMARLSPFQKGLQTEVQSDAGAVGAAGDKLVAQTGRNVSDAIVGKLPVSAEDVGTGLFKTIKGIGSLAQGFNQGVEQLSKSVLASIYGKEAVDKGYSYGDGSLMRSITGSDSVSTIQDFAKKSEDHALSIGATPLEAKMFGSSMAFGLALADNPFFGPEKASFNLTKEAVADLVKATDEKAIGAILMRDGVPADVAEKVAPIFKTANSPKLVRTAAQEIANGVDNVRNGSVERGFVTSVKERIPELETRVAGQYIPRSTDTLSMKAANLVKDDLNAATDLAMKGTDEKAVATAVELIKKYSADAEAATDQAVKDNAYDQAAKIANEIARKLTESGRTVQAASILSRLTPEGQVRFAAREIQRFNETARPAQRIPELTGEQTATITKKFQAAQSLPEGAAQARAFAEAEDYVKSLVPTPLFQKIVSVWKAGLLTGLKTSGLNIGSNLFHGISEIAKDAPAALVDSVASIFTGKRTTGFTLKGTAGGIRDGFQKGADYIKTGFDERQSAKKLDLGKVNFGDSPFAKTVQAYEQTVFRTIGAEDMPFYYGAKARSIADQAYITAKNEGLTGKELTARAEELMQNPDDEMIRFATLDAETAIFQNSTMLGKMARDMQKVGGGAGNIVIPFGRTPGAVVMQLFNYSPVGLVSQIAGDIAKGQFSQRMFAKAAGRAAVGTGALYLGAKLFDSGKIALGYPDKESDREQWKIEGKQPNSVKIGDKWRQVGTLGPLGMSLVIGGYIQNGIKNTGSFWGGVSQGAFGALQTLTQQTFLSGLTSFLDAISDPQQSAQNYFSGLLSSLIPTIVGDVARGTDTYERDTTSGGLGDVVNRVKAKIPGVRETLQPQVDALGNRTKTPDFFTVMLDPSRPTSASNDPTVKELSRLQEGGYSVTPSELGNKSGFQSLTKDQNTKLRRRAGELLKNKLDNLFADESYQKLADDEKEKVIDKFATGARDAAKAEMVLFVTNGLSGDAYKKKLSDLKADKMMTKDVFSLYQQIR